MRLKFFHLTYDGVKYKVTLGESGRIASVVNTVTGIKVGLLYTSPTSYWKVRGVDVVAHRTTAEAARSAIVHHLFDPEYVVSRIA